MGRKRKSEVEQVEPQEQATDSGVSVEESASNEAAKEEAAPVEDGAAPAVDPADDQSSPDPEQKTAHESSTSSSLEDHRAELYRSDEGETIDEMNARIRKLWHMREREKEAAKADASFHSEQIKSYEQQIGELVRKVEEADIEEVLDHERGIAKYVRRSTQEVLRTRPLAFAEKQAELPFDRPSSPPPGAPEHEVSDEPAAEASNQTAAPIPELAEGQHWRMADDGAEGCRLVTITGVDNLTHVSVRWAHSGLGGSIPRGHFATAAPATVEEIDAALVPDEQPAKRTKKGKGRAAEED